MGRYSDVSCFGRNCIRVRNNGREETDCLPWAETAAAFGYSKRVDSGIVYVPGPANTVTFDGNGLFCLGGCTGLGQHNPDVPLLLSVRRVDGGTDLPRVYPAENTGNMQSQNGHYCSELFLILCSSLAACKICIRGIF